MMLKVTLALSCQISLTTMAMWARIADICDTARAIIMTSFMLSVDKPSSHKEISYEVPFSNTTKEELNQSALSSQEHILRASSSLSESTS